MAFTDGSEAPARIPTTSYDTALCIIPPRSQCGYVDQLRELYDKAFGRWPAHINLIYPFVPPDQLPRAQKQIENYFAEHVGQDRPLNVELAQAGCFVQKNKCTIYLTEEGSGDSDLPLESLRTMALEALGQRPLRSTLHLTVGQSQDNTVFARSFLLEKARLLPSLRFSVGSLAILIRERTTGSSSTDHMRLYATINLQPSNGSPRPDSPDYWVRSLPSNVTVPQFEENAQGGMAQHEHMPYDQGVQSGLTYCFDEEEFKWSPYAAGEPVYIDTETIRVASYNVLVDSEYPPTHDRDPLIVSTILSDSAMADVLLLQEISDDFLSYLLSDTEIQRRYPFVSHGPPTQLDIGPLPSFRNIVILSCYPFAWNSVPFYRKHKGAIVAQFRGMALPGSSSQEALVVAGVHLTAGLTDGSVATKSAQMKTLITYLEQNHREDPWIIAGDFNIVTSTHTIETARKNKSITEETANTLLSIETAISDAGFVDAWNVARVEAIDQPSIVDMELFEGEEGATFDPQNNRLAAGTTTTSHDRPQRYDRILVRPKNALRIIRFNHFGLPETIDGVQVIASDHYGVRTTMKITSSGEKNSATDTDSTNQPLVQPKRAIPTLLEPSSISSVLAAYDMIPSEEQTAQRQEAFETLEKIVLNTASDPECENSGIPLVMVPVGSYALNVWTADSDIDCLCIGAVSPKTFFKLARQRLVKAANPQVRILRKVEASTGTMLELSVNGALVDLQYCPAAKVLER